MKKIYILLFFSSIITFGQTQIGNDINGEAANNYFGTSIAMSEDGNILAVGADGNDGNGIDSGHVRVFENLSGNWTQIGNDINGENSGDISGFNSISLSSNGQILAIGAVYNNGNGDASGHVRVFQNIAGNWIQIGNDIDGEAAGDLFGYSVALSSNGNILAAGAPYNNGNGSGSGHVRVFQNLAGNWVQIGNDINGAITNAGIGKSISISSDGNTIAIGARNALDANASVRVFQNISGTWNQVGNTISNSVNYGFGNCVSISSNGTIVAIASDNENKVRVFKNILGTWTQIGSTINGQNNGDNFGYSLYLSSDGQILAIGAINNDTNGTNSGQVKIYKFSSNNWNQLATINGQNNSDYLGSSVCFPTNNNNKLAVGAFYSDANGTDSGQVKIYDLSALLSSDQFILKNFNIYPNPANENVSIKLNENLQLEKVNIYNLSGQFIKTEMNQNINVSNLSKGNYIFEVITDKGKAAKTVLIK